MTVSSRSSSSVTPSGAVTADRVDGVADDQMGDVVLDGLGDLARERLDVELARDLLEHAALDDPGGLLGAGELERGGRVDRDVEADAEEVDVQRVAAHGVVAGRP